MKRKIGVIVVLVVLFVGSPVLAGVKSFFDVDNKTISSGLVAACKYEYDIVIIAPEKFTQEIQPLVDHKNNHGVQTIVKTTEDIYSAYEGRDDAEKVKYFIKDALEQWNITYVLLVGGKKGQSFEWYVPVRYSNLDDGFSRYTMFISDLYFADIYRGENEFEDWDSDGDGVFSEWIGFTNKDVLDLVPDVYVGRLPCRNEIEVSTIVDKIIGYENNVYGELWFKKMVVAGGDTFPAFEGPEGELTCDRAAGYMKDFQITKLYATEGTLTGPEDVINAINEGCGFFFTRAKGGTDRIRIVTTDETEFVMLHNRHLTKLKNMDAHPICFLGECFHGKFDVCILNFIKLLLKDPNYHAVETNSDVIFECIAWQLVRQKGGGAIATVSNTNLCFGSGGDTNNNGINDDSEGYGGWLAVEFCKLYREEGLQTLGEIYGTSIKNYIDLFPVRTNKIHYKSVEEYILIGDPSLKIGGYP